MARVRIGLSGRKLAAGKLPKVVMVAVMRKAVGTACRSRGSRCADRFDGSSLRS
jgi:hypothetical protein